MHRSGKVTEIMIKIKLFLVQKPTYNWNTSKIKIEL